MGDWWIGDIRVFKIKGTGHQGSRSTGAGWYAELPDGRRLKEDQAGSSWPPYPVIAVAYPPGVRAVKTQREAASMARRYLGHE